MEVRENGQVIPKVCERAAHSQFTNFLDLNNVIRHLQSGNRKLHSTESALLHFTDELLNNMDQKKISVVVLLDMSKAFDSIRHDLMLRKLRKLLYLSLRVPGSKAVFCNVNKSLNFRMLYLIPYPLRLGYGKDPSWARCCLHCM